MKTEIEEILKDFRGKLETGWFGELNTLEETTSSLTSLIIKWLEGCIPAEKDICYSKINMGFADSREYRQEGWNACIEEIKDRISKL